MEENNLYPVSIFDNQKILSIQIYPTDNKQDILYKILNIIDSPLLFFEKNFDWIAFLKKKSKQPLLQLDKLDLFRLSGKNIIINFPLLEKLESKFQFTPNEVLFSNKIYLYYCLLYMFIFCLKDINRKIPKKKTRLPSIAVKSTEKQPPKDKPISSTEKEPPKNKDPPSFFLISPTFDDKFEKIYFQESKFKHSHIIEMEKDKSMIQFRKKMEENFLPKNYKKTFFDDFKIIENIYKEYNRKKILIQEQLKLSNDSYKFFHSIQPIEYTETEFNGRIFSLEIQTDIYNTGFLFDNLQLNESLPFAHYKKFFKFYKNTQTSVNTEKNDNLYIYRQKIKENVQIFCKNIKKGLFIQVLLLNDSYIETLDSVFTFLHMDPNLFKIISKKPSGILGSFEFKDTTFQNFLISDLIMNDEFFQKFLLLNDTEKIARENNSIYIYFKNITETFEQSESIEVGGWNKENSRFGDVTVTLTPYQKENNFFVQSKIHRAVNEEILENFKKIMGRLLNIYNLRKPSLEEYFRQYLKIIPNPISVIPISSKIGTLGYENDIVFPGEYARTCQKPRKPRLLKSEEELLSLNLTSEEMEQRVLKFPKELFPYKNIKIEPSYYYCENDSHPFIGYVPIKNLTKDHPFQGNAPCCFKLPQKKKNEKIEKLIYENITISKEKNITTYKIKKNKIIEHTGQIGELSDTLKNFFTFLSPLENFVRIGISTDLSSSSLLHACEYAYQYSPNEIYVPNLNIRNELLSLSKIPSIAQENIHNSFQTITELRQNEKKPIDVRNLYSLIQQYFSLNIIILNQNGEFIKPHSNFSFKYILYENNPILLLLEHSSPLRYEIIGLEKKTLFSKKSPIYNQLLYLFHKEFQTFEKNVIHPPIPFRHFRQFKTFSHTQLLGQNLSKNGQLRILNLKHKDNFLSIYLENTLPPMSLKIQENLLHIPTLTHLHDFLNENFNNEKKEYFKISSEYSFIKIKKFIFPFQTDINFVNMKEISFHPILFYIKKIINSFSIFCNIYLIVNLLKDYILILFGQYRRVEKNINIQQFKKKYLSFVPKSEFKINKEISIYKLKNNWLFSKNSQLILPKELENIIDYFLEWNNSYNTAEIDIWKQKNVVSHYHFSSQFQTIVDNYIQTSNQSFPNKHYYSYYTFSLDKIPKLDEKIIYYYYNKIDIQPFFLFHKKKTNILELQYEEIHNIMYFYYKYGILSFQNQEESTTDKYKSLYTIIEKNDLLMVLFPFA